MATAFLRESVGTSRAIFVQDEFGEWIPKDDYSQLKVWDVDTLDWVKMTQPGGSSGGDVTVTNWPATYPTEANNEAQVVYESGDILYVCKAALGSIKTNAVWQIKKVNVMDITWCDGNDNYDNVATSLAVVELLSFS